MRAKRSQPRPGPHQGCDAIGTLYLVGVPIGHSDDITIRALHTLRTVSCIASENPQATQALLEHHAVAATVTSYGPQQLSEKIAILLDRLKHGQDVAFVSDCGMPIWLDPGHLLVRAAHAAQVPVRVIPGPSAMTAALALSGFSGDAILVENAVHENSRALAELFARITRAARTSLLHIAPRDLSKAIDRLAQSCPQRAVVIALDITKVGERILRGQAAELRTRLPRLPAGTDVTLVIEGLEPDRKQRTIGRGKRRASRLRGGGSSRDKTPPLAPGTAPRAPRY